MGKKLKVAWVTFACCEDSSILFVELLNDHFFEWNEKIEFRVCRMLKKAALFEDIDVAFIEGAIALKEDEEKLRHLREVSKKVVAVGSCACTGMPSAQRNYFDEKTKGEIEMVINRFGHMEKVVPLKSLVKVDYEVPGCPMDEKVFLEVLQKCFSEFGV
jgi:coenzyme F420-reducing hydrogenase gamma subunit